MKKFLKITGIVIAIIIALPLITALFVSKEYAVVRETTINKSKTEVFEYVKYLKNQDNYSVWAKKDPDMRKDYKGTDATVGFVSSWESDMEEVGKGEQEITKIEEGKRIDYELRFIEPFEAKDHAYMTFESVSDSLTKVQWGFHGKMKYPMNIMLLFINMEEMLGKDLDTGLTNLKGILEKQ